MATVNAKNNPKISDVVVFDLPCPDSNGCFDANPYKVDNVKIFHISRNINGDTKKYDKVIYDEPSLKAAEEAEELACTTPTENNIAAAKRLRAEATAKSYTTPFYFTEANAVKIIGNSENPAWLSTDIDNALITNVEEDADGNAIYGQFQYEWSPTGMREGDYFVCWTWTSLPAGTSSSSHFHFNLAGATQLTTSIPSHFTDADKYKTLLDLYLPEMFSVKISDTDKTPEVMDKLNNSIASGFTFLEDMANQIMDLMDANAVHESLLPLLGNFFNLKLKSDDPTLWRRQIKQAIPLFKRKGTKGALKEALAQANIKLLKLTKLWQVVSKYTWQESFLYNGDECWALEKVALPVDLDNFGLWIRYSGTDDYIELSEDYVTFTTSGGVTTMCWAGNNLSTGRISLENGDRVKVLYKVAEVPNETEQIIEDYIRDLLLIDQRDEENQAYPPKNWNVRALEEDDALFDIIVPNRHPYYDPVLWGKIRTEFPWGENAYNMDEYNGSLRDSTDPCFIDKEFTDVCSGCLSSSYNIDIEIENLTNDRLIETQDILKEFTPFHAVLHSLNFIGGINEYVKPPLEEVEMLMTYTANSNVIAGEGQMYFHRSMLFGLQSQKILRNQLASKTAVVSDASGIAYNSEIVLFSPDVMISELGYSKNGTTIMENLTDCTISEISSVDGHTAVISINMTDFDGNPTTLSEPLSEAAFTFRLSNPVFTGNLSNIFQDNIVTLRDANENYGLLGVRSDFDVENNGDSGSWEVYIPDYSVTPYTIKNVLPDGSLVLNDPLATLPTSNAVDVSYVIKTDGGTEVVESTTGLLVVKKRGRVRMLNSTLTPIENIIKVGYYLVYSGSQYKINGFVEDTDNEFYIEDYSSGDVAGVDIKVYQRLADKQIGYYSHRGLKMRCTGVDYETSLGINNGKHAFTDENVLENNRFKENFLIVIGDDYFAIEEIDGDSPSGSTTFTLSGPTQYWKTFDAGGTNVTFSIYRYDKEDVTIPGQQFGFTEHTFDILDRRGREIVTQTTETDESSSVSSLSNDGIYEEIEQTESVTFEIEWADGKKETRSI